VKSEEAVITGKAEVAKWIFIVGLAEADAGGFFEAVWRRVKFKRR
jgi:hypothetical protein